MRYFINNSFLVKEFLKSMLHAKWLIVSYTHSPYTIVLKDAELAR